MVTQQLWRGSFFCHCEAQSAEAIPWGHRIATHLSGARNDTKKGRKMTGKIMAGFMYLTM